MDVNNLSALGYQGLQGGSPVPAPPQSPINKMFGAVSPAHDVIDRVCRLADALAGSQPEAPGNQLKSVGSGGLFGEFDACAERLESRLTDARRALSRIEQNIPSL